MLSKNTSKFQDNFSAVKHILFDDDIFPLVFKTYPELRKRENQVYLKMQKSEKKLGRACAKIREFLAVQKRFISPCLGRLRFRVYSSTVCKNKKKQR